MLENKRHTIKCTELTKLENALTNWKIYVCTKLINSIQERVYKIFYKKSKYTKSASYKYEPTKNERIQQSQ